MADETDTTAMKYKKKTLNGHKHLDKVIRKEGTTLSTVPDIQTMSSITSNYNYNQYRLY